MQFSARDFVDKSFQFYSNGKFYKYSTSIDDSEKDGVYDADGPVRSLENPDDEVRGFTLFNVAII